MVGDDLLGAGGEEGDQVRQGYRYLAPDNNQLKLLQKQLIMVVASTIDVQWMRKRLF